MSRAAQFLGATVLAVLAVGCEPGGARPSVTAGGETENAVPQASFTDLPGQFPQPATLTESGSAAAPVKGCVNVSGSSAHEVLTVADCASQLGVYRVIQRVVTSDQCVADADRSFHYRDAHTQWTACLDVNWDAKYCINLDPVITKVACDDPRAPRKLRAVSVLADTTTVDECTQYGFPRLVRRYTICTEAQP